MTALVPLILSLAPSAQDHSPLHPAEASFFAQVPDIPGLVSAYKQSAYAKLLTDPELLEAIANVMGEEEFDPIGMFMGELEQAEASGDIPAIRPLLASLRAVSISINLRDNDLGAMVALLNGAGGMTNQKEIEAEASKNMGFQFVVDFADEKSASDALGFFFDQMSEEDKSVLQASEVEGPRGTMKRWQANLENEPMVSTWEFFQDQNRIWGSMGSLDVEKRAAHMAAGGATVAERMGANHMAMGLPKGKTLFEVHNRVGDQIMDTFEGMIESGGASGILLQMAEAMGGPGYSMLLRDGSWRMSANGGRFMTQGQHTARKDSELDGAIGLQNLSKEAMSLVHPEAVAGGIISLDADQLSSWMRRMVKEEGEEEEMAQMFDQYGFRIIEDLIEPLGSAAAWSLNGNIGISAPPFQISAEVRDAEALRRGIAGLARMMAEEGGDSATVTSKPYRGFEVTTVKFNGDAFDSGGMPINPADLVQPSFVVLEDRVVMTLNSLQAKREIKRVLKGEGELNPLLAGDNIPDGGAGEIGFANWIEVVGRLYSAGKSFAPMMMGQMEGAGAQLDLAALPSAEMITRHFTTSYNWKRHAAGGVQYYGESSFGFEGSALPMALLVGVAGSTAVRSGPIALEAPMPTPELEQSGTNQAQADIAAIQQAVEQFQISNGGNLPSDLQVLWAKDTGGASYLDWGGRGNFDAWGNAYLYWVADDNTQFAVWSAGPNGIDEFGEGDDVISNL